MDIDLPEQEYRRNNPPPEPRADGRTGAPRKELDPEAVFKLARLGANNCEIAEFFNVSEGLIRKRYADVVRSGRTNMKIRLRQAQMREAMAGNVTMLIWLGKQLLNQTDQGERDADDNQPLPWSDN
jgi:hypothetical protein